MVISSVQIIKIVLKLFDYRFGDFLSLTLSHSVLRISLKRIKQLKTVNGKGGKSKNNVR